MTHHVGWHEIATASLILAAAGVAEAAGADLAVTNFKNGETIRYSTPLITGTTGEESLDSVVLVNATSRRPSRTMKGLAHKGRFKVLADLVPGTNALTLTAGAKTLSLNLVFTPQTTPRIVRAVYYTDKTGDAGYLSPKPNDSQNVTGKLSTAMLLMQSFAAEAMNQQGYGRKTFNVELGGDGQAKVFIIKGNQEPNAGLNGGALDEAIATQAARPDTYYLVILGRGCGYTAVGGGGKALFGGACIYSWPDTIQEAQAAFMDATPIDSGKFHVDAIGRDVFWANTSTCIGACLHEINHVFWLPHSMDGFDVMTRGHDYFNRFFTLVEPPSKVSAKPVEFTDDQVARYCKVTANNLACSRFMALDKQEYHDQYKVGIAYEPDQNQIRVTSDLGIAFLGLEVLYANPGADYCVPIDPNKPAPKEILVPAREWERFNGGQFQVRVIDIEEHGTTDRDPLKGQYGKKP